LGKELGSLKANYPADVIIFDPDSVWKVDPDQFLSKGKNTPLSGETLKGKVKMTIYGGEIVYRDEDF
jgi:dihydroorotase